jgi:hypothetical protein
MPSSKNHVTRLTSLLLFFFTLISRRVAHSYVTFAFYFILYNYDGVRRKGDGIIPSKNSVPEFQCG